MEAIRMELPSTLIHLCCCCCGHQCEMEEGGKSQQRACQLAEKQHHGLKSEESVVSIQQSQEFLPTKGWNCLATSSQLLSQTEGGGRGGGKKHKPNQTPASAPGICLQTDW